MLEMVGRGCFRSLVSLPGKGRDSHGGGWEAYFDERDRARLGQLAEYIPTECITSPAIAKMSRGSVLNSFINCLLDAFVRESVGYADFTKGSAEPLLPELYMNTLGTGSSIVKTAGR